MQSSFKQNSFFFFIAIAFLGACKDATVAPDYRGEMRKFVQKISDNGRVLHPGFIIVPQNGLGLLSGDGTPQGASQNAYIAAIDGVGQEEPWFGYNNKDDEATPEPEHTDLLNMCVFARSRGLKVIATDYASTQEKVDRSYAENFANNFISFAADHRELDNIPAYPSIPFHQNSNSVNSLADAQNYLYLISPSGYASKEEFIHALEQTNYDLMVLDLFFDDTTQLNSADLNRLRTKAIGGTRKIICYMSIGEAESYRWYWKPFWYATPPSFIVAEDPYWINNFSVRYWDPEWQSIICGPNDSYLKRIVNAGFDGVYLDLVSEYEYFEE